ncbi:WecB/TagA/CpsF family glycosyltransferase [Luteolibacter sp. AS25]|uniref:WecB/TagA/CpsF family glycosyltransferase n=1 Tax=Luteolibacter sp. AS25 TaxID=3135776 RepID=UPI00398AF26B
MKPQTKTFLGIHFWNRNTTELLATADKHGGLFTVPSAPSLAEIRTDEFLKVAYQSSDFAVVDGGYIALILRIFLRKQLPRISGLQILQRLIGVEKDRAIPFHERRILFVVPSVAETLRIQLYLATQGFSLHQLSFYEAPFYREDEDYQDSNLAEKMKSTLPDWVVMCIGGGKQEKLGYYVRSLSGSLGPEGARKNGPVILCTGGAISFFTGSQAKIPTWADRMYLGWLFRICESPGVFLPRYWKATFEFPRLLWQQREKLFHEEEPRSTKSGAV